MNDAGTRILAYADGSLLLQGLFLLVLWATLFRGWRSRARRFPGDFAPLGAPAPTHVAVAAATGGLVLAASLAGLHAAQWVLGLALAAGAFLSVLDPVLALCFTLSQLLIRPWEIMEPNGLILLLPRFSTVFSIGWALYFACRIDGFGIRVNRALLLLAAYVGWLALTAFATPSPGTAWGSLKDTLMPTLTLTYLVFQLARSRYSVWALKTTLLFVFTGAGLISIYLYACGYHVGGRILSFGAFANTNDIAAVMTILLPLAAVAWFAAGTLHHRALAGFSISVALVVLALAQSRGAVIAVGAGAVALALKKVRNKALVLLIAAMVAAGGMAATTLFKRDQGDLGGSTASRTAFWLAGLKMAALNPVLGVGFNEFPANVESYAVIEAEESGQHTAHSAWILALGESGLVGMTLFVCFYFQGWLKPAAALYPRDPSWYYAGAMYTASISFLSHTYIVFPYLMAAIVMAAYRAEARA